MEYVTVSAKVDREFYRRLKKYGVNISRVIKRALEEELRRREEEEVRRMLDRARRILGKIPEDELIDAIRRSRDEQ